MVIDKTQRKYLVVITPKGTKSRFNTKGFNTKKEAEKKVKQIKKIPITKRDIINPRVRKNPFFKKKR